MGESISIKERIKRIKPIISLYEAVFDPIHVIQKRCRARKASFHSYGKKNKDKVFMVIWNESPANALFSFILFKLGAFKYADQKGYIPIMDFKNHYAPMMQEPDKEGIENSWEYYFMQPDDGYSLDEVYESKRVYLYDRNAFKIPRYDTGIKLLTSKEELKEWNLYFNKYIRLQPLLNSRIEQEYKKFQDKKILGVAVRAAAYFSEINSQGTFSGHNRAPSCDELISIIEEKMEMWGYKYIFFVTEDRYYHERVKKHFNDHCLSIDRPLFNYFDNDGEPVTSFDSRIKEFSDSRIEEKNKDYISEIYLLARCDAIYSTIEGGTICAAILNGGKYKHSEFYCKGDL